jgi:hypothetical protein
MVSRHEWWVRIATRPSTWLVVVSIVFTAFSALPTLASFVLHVLNVGVLALAIWRAHHEGRHA